MRRPNARSLVAWGIAACILLGAPAAAPAAVDLEGTWYVLVHYRDDTTHDKTQLRWEDRIWVFERKGRDLLWKEYPIVVFQDESGRFERRSSGQNARVVGAWEPSPGQLAEIQSGLQFNSRGAKQKTVKGSDSTGWSSGGGARSQAANIITYSETWSVESPNGNPVFVRIDSMGSSEDDVAEGRTEYRTEAVENGGHQLTGTFTRDGTRHGTFRMMRTGVARALDTTGKTPNEKARERALEQILRETGKNAEKLTPEEIDRLLRERGVE